MSSDFAPELQPHEYGPTPEDSAHRSLDAAMARTDSPASGEVAAVVDGTAPGVGVEETLAERGARFHAWLANVKPGDIVTVRLNSTDTLTGKVYEAPDPRGTSLCVNTTVLRHGNGYPGGSYELIADTAPAPLADAPDDVEALAIEICARRNPSRPPIPRACGICREDAALLAVSDYLAARDADLTARAEAAAAERIAQAIEAAPSVHRDGAFLYREAAAAIARGQR